MNKIFTFFGATVFAISMQAQVLGVYDFTGVGACPNQNPIASNVATDITFSSFSLSGITCVSAQNVFNSNDWPSTGIDLAKYYEFTATASVGKSLNLDSLNFASRVSSDVCNWYVRSSVDNYASNLFSGNNDNVLDTNRNLLPASFENLTTVTFRFYASNTLDNGRTWRVDDVTLKGTVVNASGANISENNSISFSVYPNPSNDIVTIKTDSKIENVKFYNLDGKLVKESAQEELINVSNLKTGSYIIEILTKEGTARVSWLKN